MGEQIFSLFTAKAMYIYLFYVSPFHFQHLLDPAHEHFAGVDHVRGIDPLPLLEVDEIHHITIAGDDSKGHDGGGGVLGPKDERGLFLPLGDPPVVLSVDRPIHIPIFLV